MTGLISERTREHSQRLLLPVWLKKTGSGGPPGSSICSRNTRSSKALPAYQNITLQALLSNKAGNTPVLSGLEDWLSIPVIKGTVTDQRKAFTLYMLQQKPYLGNINTDKIK